MAELSPPAKNLQCAYCTKSFGRSEHLKRHERIHTADKQHQCPECQKSFGRRDALQRHQQIHQTDAPSLLLKGARACTHCAAAKVRCSGDANCSRCRQRSLACTYPSGHGIGAVSEPEPSSQYGSVAAPETTPSQYGSVAGAQQAPSQYETVSAPLHATPSAPVQMPLTNAMAPEPISTPAMMWTFQDSTGLDADFWNPNILSTANWLDAVVDPGFPDFPMDMPLDPGPMPQVDAYNDFAQQAQVAPAAWSAQQPVETGKRPHDQRSPAGLVSMASGLSVGSTESAAEACAASEASAAQTGEYYIDGEPGRIPRTKRRKLSSPTETSKQPIPTSSQNFSLQNPLPANLDLSHRIAMPREMYNMFEAAYRATCYTSGPWTPFDHVDFPPQEVFEHLLSLYFSSFYKTLPFLHPPTFNATGTHWLLLLALASIGAHYLGVDNNLFAVSLHELLRRSLSLSRENSAWMPPAGIILAQVEMLLLVGLLYSGDERHRERGMEMQGLFSLCHDAARNEYHQAAKSRPPSKSSHPELDDKWKSWVRLESAKRTAYCAWLLSTMIRYQIQLRRSLSLADATLPLPCHEMLWTVNDPEEWDKAMAGYAAPPPLQESLQQIYIDKRLPKERGEFARILLIHGLYQWAWEIERYYGSPLSSWSPTAKKQESAELLPKPPVWLPSIDTYNKWQNSTCDSLDILHWQANATIGQASGLEHPTVGHLHLARVVLLSPINHIVKLAKVMTNGDADATQKQDLDKHRLICRRWAVQGVYKARLAAIHAGATMWHTRRYSVDGFHEAPAVALATLMLWAFSTFSVKHRPPAGNRPATSDVAETPTRPSEGGSGDDAADAACGIILLDRPTDDELVQQFIRQGATMCAHVTNVGDLYGPKGAELVLSEGIKLLGSLRCWGVAANWTVLLERLLGVCRGEKAQAQT